jgi:hypothetical protein
MNGDKDSPLQDRESAPLVVEEQAIPLMMRLMKWQSELHPISWTPYTL